ncbi:MAG: phage antirepressor KilAC domain-containing protein [Dyadobacter sp.]|uniref:phage antirepressor KilAC domain-containing protein n=1 Tax=Dyadobacter sp. TaxID=1914288 RepID=UPI001AFE0471|nr:phage antirepressor KilAC domain-containing protein [Dyadobacter sp.]MBO9613389.1 phage antirepressor KilAC domain-containing protein [Dyadobacter sp.]
MQELIQIGKSTGGRDIVSARDLYQFLGPSERFNNWFDRQLGYGFIEGTDYVGCKVFNTLARQELDDFVITIEMAKEISMIQRSERGKQARQYFIACEQRLRENAQPVYSLPTTHAEALRQLAEKVESEERLLKENAELRPKAAYTDMVLSSVDEWTTTTIAKGLGLSAIQLNNLLCQMQVQYRHDGSFVLYARYQNKGLAKQRTFPFISRSTNETRTRTYLVWTETGKEFIHRLLNPVLKEFAEAARQQAS